MKIIAHVPVTPDSSADLLDAIRRTDERLLTENSPFFFELAERAVREVGERMVVLCNMDTGDILPTPLDWQGRANALQLNAPVYLAAQEALNLCDFPREVVVLVYHEVEDVLSIYTLAEPIPLEAE